MMGGGEGSTGHRTKAAGQWMGSGEGGQMMRGGGGGEGLHGASHGGGRARVRGNGEDGDWAPKSIAREGEVEGSYRGARLRGGGGVQKEHMKKGLWDS